ncbi:MAG: hypothetical protein COB78_09100 [Hyphomicrobiales bacterium]|nr:MAG: hypothetical protein COB78_09100 [Hyphomicrobiales bacterium]
MRRIPLAGIAALAILLGSFQISLAQHTPNMHAAHSAEAGDTMLPTEGGQSAFAAMAEIVAILIDDPDTDWSKVNISALREHLVDMNELTLNAKATQAKEAGAVVFTITGEGRTLRAIQSMVPAHTKELDKIEGWTASAKTIPTGAIMIVASKSDAELAKIAALGFFGMMSIGAHHQPHHLAMATGNMMMH